MVVVVVIAVFVVRPSLVFDHSLDHLWKASYQDHTIPSSIVFIVFIVISTHGTAVSFDPIPGQGKRGLSTLETFFVQTTSKQVVCWNAVLIPLHGQEIPSHGG
jgi:hypothetical protein